jgi:hypothetical protein
MTAITHSHAGFNAPAATRTVKAAKAGAGFSAKEFFAILQHSCAWPPAIPDVGRISAKDVANVRAMLVDAK